MLIRRILDDVSIGKREIAEQAGLSYHTLYAWHQGRNTPRPDNLRELAKVLDGRAELLQSRAEVLRVLATQMEREGAGG